LEASPGKYFARPYLEKPFTKIGLVEWLKVKALSSSPSTAKKQNKTNPESKVDVTHAAQPPYTKNR
jgi:hypothetical protein